MPDDDGFSIETTALQSALWKVVFTTIVPARIDDVNILVAIRWVAKAWLAVKKLQSANVSISWYTGLYFECRFL